MSSRQPIKGSIWSSGQRSGLEIKIWESGICVIFKVMRLSKLFEGKCRARSLGNRMVYLRKTVNSLLLRLFKQRPDGPQPGMLYMGLLPGAS